MPDSGSKTSNDSPDLKDACGHNNDDKRKILLVATTLCLVCSVLVSTAAVKLRPLQEENAQNARKIEILKVAGLSVPQVSVDAFFSRLVLTKIVDLNSGEYQDDINVNSFDERDAARDDDMSMGLHEKQDIAGIQRRANFMRVYLIPDEQGETDTIVLPVHGFGLWSTMYGFLALKSDGRTIAGLTFYEQAETAGLGAEVANPNWLAQFSGRPALDAHGKPLIRINKGPVNTNDPAADYLVDGISGATLTGNGVTNLLHFWLGELGFGPYLANVSARHG